MTNTKLKFPAIGTQWQIDLYQDYFSPDLVDLIKQTIKNFESTYSRFIDSSLVSQMSRQSGDYVLDKDGIAMIEMYLKLNSITSGAFSPTIGQLLNQSGYDSQYSFKSNQMTPMPLMDKILKFSPPNILTVLNPCQLDFGGIGKGYLIDVISNLIFHSGLKSYCIDAGGDMYYRHQDKNPLQVGLENPLDFNLVIGTIPIINQALAASSGNRRTWGKFHHIIDPQSLTSPNHILATWVISDQTIIADALATCLFLVTPQKLTPHFDFNYMILYSDLTFAQSPGFNAEIFIE